MKQAAILSMCVALCVAVPAQAIYIDFSGLTPGGLNGQASSAVDGDGVSLVSANWQGTNDGTVTAGSLGTGGSVTSADPYYVHAPAWGDGPSLTVSGVDTVNGFWAHTLYRLDGSTGGNFSEVGFFAGGGGDGQERIGLGQSGFGSTNLGIIGKASIDSGIAIVENQTYLLVMQYDPSDSGNELKLWVDPDLTQPAPAPTASGAADPSHVEGIDTIVIRGGNQTPHSVDNIYLGNNTPFVPEPATMSMLVLGGLGVLIRRRRRS